MRVTSAKRSFEFGLVAEDRVAEVYRSSGAVELARRWRGKAGELDLIVREADTVVFVEVKSSKTFDRAAAALSHNQAQRIMLAAEEFCGTLDTGLLTDMRFDVALVTGVGVEILANAIFQ